MSIKVKCFQCGAENELNRVFCAKCGGKLDLKSVVAEPRVGRASRFMLGLVRQAVALALLSALGLALWPVEPRGAMGSREEARSMAGKLELLNQAVRSGTVVSQVITDAEVNGYIAAILKQNTAALQSEGFRLGIRGINVAFLRDDFIVLILANWGPVSLSYEAEIVPSVSRARFETRVTGARLGHLPLPGPAAVWMSRRVARIFSRMEKELSVLNSLARFDLGNGRLYAATGGR